MIQEAPIFDPEKPFNRLPELPPKTELETKAVLRLLTRASRSLAELKGRTRSLPNPDILLSTLALNEAKDSSEIENIFTTHDELFRGLSMDSFGLSAHAKEVLHYREALWNGHEIIRKRPIFSTNLCVDLVEIIKENSAGIRTQAGTRIVNDKTKAVIYTPPEGESIIRDKLAALERFANLHDDSLDPLLKAALIHYQFEAIHPFYDGNGRAGRVLFILYLLMTGLLEWPVLYLSHHIIRTKNEYYRGLRSVTEKGAWEPWLLYMLAAVDETARDTSQRIVAIESLLANFLTRGRELLQCNSKELAELLFVRPYCKIAHVEEQLDVSRQTASTYLREMETKGFVKSLRVGREVLFINYRLTALLTDSKPAPMP
jgi:Fic family protein